MENNGFSIKNTYLVGRFFSNINVKKYAVCYIFLPMIWVIGYNEISNLERIGVLLCLKK